MRFANIKSFFLSVCILVKGRVLIIRDLFRLLSHKVKISKEVLRMDEEDKYLIYYPKRQVNNRNSKYLPHVISGFISPTMDRMIECESQGEELLYSILEMSSSVIEYFPQPVEVPVGETKWPHIPDVLVFFREEVPPWLIQVKGGLPDTEVSPKEMVINRACERYARDRRWKYKVLYPNALDKTVRANIKGFFPFMNEDRRDDTISELLMETLEKNWAMTFEELAHAGEPEISKLKVMPVLRREIAFGNLYADFSKPINQRSKIRIAIESDDDLFKKYFAEMEKPKWTLSKAEQ